MALPDRCVRRATITDLPFVLKAQASMPHDLDAASEEEVAYALATGRAECYILFSEGRYRAILGVQASGEHALLAGFYREAPSQGLRRDALRMDAQTLLDTVLPILRERGIKHLHARVSLRNKRYRKLVQFYKAMLGLRPVSVNLEAKL